MWPQILSTGMDTEQILHTHGMVFFFYLFIYEVYTEVQQQYNNPKQIYTTDISKVY